MLGLQCLSVEAPELLRWAMEDQARVAASGAAVLSGFGSQVLSAFLNVFLSFFCFFEFFDFFLKFFCLNCLFVLFFGGLERVFGAGGKDLFIYFWRGRIVSSGSFFLERFSFLARFCYDVTRRSVLYMQSAYISDAKALRESLRWALTRPTGPVAGMFFFWVTVGGGWKSV